MELSEYIKDTLISVVKGIEESQKQLSEDGSNAVIAPSLTSVGDAKFIDTDKGRRAIHEISFTIAVTVDGESGSEAGAGVRLNVLSLGGKSSTKKSETEVNTISFSVPVSFPSSDSLTNQRPKVSFSNVSR